MIKILQIDLKPHGTTVAESDLKEEVKFLHDTYDNIQLEVDLSKWNFCLFDIEVASDDSGFPFAEKAAVPINLITCYSSKHKQTFTWGLGEYTGHDSVVKNYRSFKDERNRNWNVALL